MKAVFYERAGPASEVLELGELPIPQRGKGEVLVKVCYTAVNPVDWKLREAKSPGYKFVPGADLAGIVEAADPESVFPPGTRIFAMVDMLRSVTTAGGEKIHYGGAAEYASVPENLVARVPDNISLREAAGVPLVGLTALQNLLKAGLGHRGTGKGRHLLVHAGAGGVGNWAIQLGKVAGARVSTTCSPKNNEFCTGLGADHCVDYHTTRFENLKDVDTAFDLMGGDYELRSLKMLPSNGHYLNIMNSGWSNKLGGGTIGHIVGYAFAAWQYFIQQHLVGPNYHFTIVAPKGKQVSGLLNLYKY
jgi:NADPH:quinone reductase-like Zn-dependent oxidoreductase